MKKLYHFLIISSLVSITAFLSPYLLAQLKCACEKQSATFSERTFAMIKPEAVKTGKSGDIIKQIELNGFTIENMVKKNLDKESVEKFYEEHKARPFFPDLVKYITSGPIIMLELKKENAVTDWRKLMGPTDPSKAEIGTLRKMFGTSLQENAVHGSASTEDAQKELAFFDSQKKNI